MNKITSTPMGQDSDKDREGGSERRIVMLDDDGEQVGDGDEITFSYGIPPVRVLASIEVIEGELWAMTPGHKPSRCKLSELRDHVEIFYKA